MAGGNSQWKTSNIKTNNGKINNKYIYCKSSKKCGLFDIYLNFLLRITDMITSRLPKTAATIIDIIIVAFNIINETSIQSFSLIAFGAIVLDIDDAAMAAADISVVIVEVVMADDDDSDGDDDCGGVGSTFWW